MVQAPEKMTMAKGAPKFAWSERSPGDPCRTVQLGFTLSYLMTDNDTQHAVDVQPCHTSATETKTAHGFLVPPDDSGAAGDCRSTFPALTAGFERG